MTTGAYEQYTSACARSSGRIIDAYSTSFGWAVRLLGRRHRQHVRNVYGLVRVADELVDGVGSEAGLSGPEQLEQLARLEEDCSDAIRSGYSSNPVVHAFADTARRCGIDETTVRPFFASMRSDVPAPGAQSTAVRSLSPEDHEDYVYGSARVVGLMCLRVFTRDEHLSDTERRTLEHSAGELGAAFQNVNFLRDFADDSQRLGRDYLGVEAHLDREERDRWIRIIRAQLRNARRALPLLPRDARRAVRAALDLFAELTRRIADTPPESLQQRRVRVPGAVKGLILVGAVVRTALERR
ncbi:phytoene synthase [Pseudoclavibacter chungangensis]|uniref:Phytoene synthase n=1 Tax=Pseudoclavibacter chungangensis TaxID=587635 RepID=A0A7J5BNV9_9MICO|nr:squalene/phytoene synthase family protein [Pseudoclavibacter chungangensis]KAB1654075.1 phytoene synthase [Pseudoclavibacter chungangensis]NYJ66013.1 phytoene/squalene synthetase [Pseudoclavibacter chungangensis]